MTTANNQPINQRQTAMANTHSAYAVSADTPAQKANTTAAGIEICLNCDDLSTLAAQVVAARQGGAIRLELCADMAQQGLTPTKQAVAIVRQAWGDAPGLVAMLRPRGGDFYYQAADVRLLQQQLTELAEAGADAVVVGPLQKNASGITDFDWPLLRTLLAQAADLLLEVNIHRAVDVLPMAARPAALQQLQQLGIQRLLTAGCDWHSGLGVAHGLVQLQQDVQLAKTQQSPKLVIGGGITLANLPTLCAQLLQADNAIAAYISFHCYSAVLTGGLVDQHKVEALVMAVAKGCSAPMR
ncbi:MAG: copper homeostasis protein CutC [Gammaproteobacteria bacterium]|nr:copper homeostasis protein CutC [Gammaproteobacteria bacterium]